MTDNIIRRSQKKAWGFTGDANGVIGLGVANNKENDDLLINQGDKEARGNGGGFPAEDAVTYEYLHSLNKADLLKLATAHEITLDKPKGNKEEILAELDAYYEVTPAE